MLLLIENVLGHSFLKNLERLQLPLLLRCLNFRMKFTCNLKKFFVLVINLINANRVTIGPNNHIFHNTVSLPQFKDSTMARLAFIN